MSETIKKHAEKILKTSATVAIVGATAFNHVVKAEEVEEVLTVEATDTVGTTGEDEALTISEAEAKKAVAQAEVEKVQEEKSKNDEAVEEAQTKLEEDKKILEEATATREQAETDFVKAEELTKELEANPDKQAEIEKEIEAKVAEVAEAKTAETLAKTEVEAQEKVVAVATSEKESAEKAVSDATTKVEVLEQANREATVLIEEKATIDASIKQTSAEVVELENKVKTATEEVKTTASAEAKQKQAELVAKQTELASLEKQHGTTVTTNETTVNLSAIVGNNKIAVPASYLAQYNTIMNYGASSTSAQQSLKTAGLAAKEVNGVVGFQNNGGYQSIQSDTTRFINVDDKASVATIETELSLFTAELVNQVRRAFNLSDVAVTDSSVSFASAVAAAYAAKYNVFNHDTMAHDNSLINTAAKANGINSGWFENVASKYATSSTLSVNQLKSDIYVSVVNMLFDDSHANFGHTKTFLKSDSTGEAYIGVGINGLDYVVGGSRGSGYSQFYEVVVGSELAPNSTFNKTSVGSKTQVVDKSVEIAAVKSEISALNQSISTLNNTISSPASSSTVTGLGAQVSAKQSELRALQNKSVELANRLATLEANKGNLQTELEAAKEELIQAQVNLATAQVELTPAETKLTELNSNLVSATKNVVDLENEVIALQSLLVLYDNPNLIAEADAALTAALDAEEQAQEQVAADEKELEVARAAQAAVAELLATKQVALEEATAVLDALIAEYEGLLFERNEEGIYAVLDENLIEDELPVFKIPTASKAPKVGGGATSSGSMMTADSSSADDMVIQALTAEQVTPSISKATTPILHKTTVIQTLTDQVLTAKQVTTPSISKTTTPILPKTGDKTSLVATVLGSMMMSGATLAGYKRRKED